MSRSRKIRWSVSAKNILFHIAVAMLLLITVSAADLQAADKLPKVKLSVKPLNLTKQVSRDEIMAAGQLGGQLYPTHELEDKAREQKIHDSFAVAIQEWNKHEYKKAVKLFKKHTEKYPDSPWAAEAVLHIGCDAQYTGRYSEADESFNSILKNLKGKEHDGAKKLVNKATLRLAVLKVAQNNFEEAGKLFTELHKSSDNWRDKTYASHWIQRLSRYKADKLAMLNCGTLALADVLRQRGKVKEAREVAGMLPATASGHSMQDLMGISSKFGYPLTGLSIAPEDIRKLALPAIVQLNPRSGGDSGHYWVLEKVQADQVELFDPQAGRRFNQSIAEFAKEWDGAVLALETGDVAGGIGAKMMPAETDERHGGCCGLPRPPDDLGPPEDEPDKDDCGAPVWSVNKVSLNLFVSDTPLWYESPIGPPVNITLSYNAQSSTAYNQPFGNKWQFNYASYLVVDPSGQIIVLMPDGRNDIYWPDGLGGYTRQAWVLNTLTKIAENHFTLRFPDDTIYEYNIPAGTNSDQPFLVKITDRYGQSLTFGYDADVQFTTITDALGRVTTIGYTNGQATSVTDPFSRSATFEYDANGNLIKLTDMGGYWTTLSYDQKVYLTAMTNPRGTTQFYVEPADSTTPNGSNPYPSPGGAMWENYRITVTSPLGGKEEFHYNGYSRYSWHVSPKNYQPYVNSDTNNYSSSVPKKKYNLYTLSGKGKIHSISNPDGGTESYSYDPVTLKRTSITNSNSHTRSFTYNSMGRTKTMTDAKGKTTTMSYAANDIDVTTVSSGLGTVSRGFDGFHNMTSVTNRLGKTTKYTYNSYGQKTSEIDALNQLTSYIYYDQTHPSKNQLKEIIRDGKVLYSFTYDAVGRVLSKTDPTGLTLVYVYDNLNRVTDVRYPDGKEESFNYSGCCPWLIGDYSDRGGRTFFFIYDQMKRLTDLKQPDGSLIKYGYDADSNLAKLTDPNSGVTRFDYDSMKRLIKKTYADGKYETYTYDGEGLLTAKANARDTAAGRTTATYSYDVNNNLTAITYSDVTPNVTYAYDDYNRVTSRVDGIGTWGYGYDAESQLLTLTGPWPSSTITYTYDDAGRRTGVQPQGSDAVTYGYDAFDRLTSVVPGTRAFTYTYPDNSPSPQFTSLSRPNGSFTTYQYDSLNRLTYIANKNSAQQLLNSDAFTYNLRDMRDTEAITNGTPITSFTANQTIYNHNNLNQLLSTLSPSQTFVYDADGNMTRGYTPDGYAFTAAYDGENRLKSIDYTDGASVQHHTVFYYSADGFLAKQVVDGVETRFLRSRYSLLQERDSSNTITRSYAWDLRAPGGIGGLLELGQGGQQYSYMYDGKGNVVTLLNGSQAPFATYTYDEFGNPMVRGGTLDQPFRFSTKTYDEKTGLSYYGYRFYLPLLGKWLNRDPLGEEDGINLYGFVENNPISFSDSLGLRSLFEGGGAYPGGASFGGRSAPTGNPGDLRGQDLMKKLFEDIYKTTEELRKEFEKNKKDRGEDKRKDPCFINYRQN